MKKTLSTVLILLCVVLLIGGSAILYRELTKRETVGDPAVIPAVQNEGAGKAGGIFAPEQTEEPVPAEQTPEYPPEDLSREPAADFSFTDRDGNPCKLSDFYGKPLIVNFWATWCGPCQMELPYFNVAAANYDGQIQFLMVDLVDGSYETEADTIRFVEDNGYSFPLYFDSYDEASAAYGITAIPLTVVIDSYGRIVTTHLGSMSAIDLQELIDLVLN